MKSRLIVLCICAPLAAIAGPGAESGVEGADDAPESLQLDPIVVIAGKSPRPLSEIAAQVTVIDAADIRNNLVEDFDGLVRYEPGLDLETSGTRFGASSINIRGVAGNRVGIEIDGTPARDQFAIGAYSSGGRALVEPDRVKRMEVLYGPASVMYGSNAMGGVVSISTWDPVDLSGLSGRPWSLGLRAGYQGVDDSWVASGIAAWGNEQHGLLAAATRRDGHELDNQAPAEIPSDVQDWDSDDFLFKYTFDTAGGSRLRLSANRAERDVRTDMQSLLGYGRRFRWTTSLQGDDRDESTRLSADYDFSAGGWERGLVRVYYVEHETDQRTREERADAPQPVLIDRQFLYGQELSGVETHAFREFAWGASVHRLGLGADWLRTEVEELRDGLQTGLVDGSTTKFILGENMPVRDFPNSRTDRLGLWIQDEISLADGRWEIIPALRWDRYDLDPGPDSIWIEDNPDTEVVSVSESRATPRLGLVYHPNETWSLYSQYSEGFRAPPFEDANIGFDIPLFGFRAIPNPDLESETSRGIEAGARFTTASTRVSLALFRNDYENFIESRALVGMDPETGDLIFQSRNIDEARIRGLDLRFDQDLAAWAEALEGWMLSLAAWWAEGENRQSSEPLNSIAPPQAVLSLNWQSANTRWDASINLTFTAAKDESDIDETDGARFATPSWTTLDLSAGWRPVDWMEWRLGLFNLTDETYWRWLDVARLEAAHPMIPLLSRPGRSASLTVRFTF